MTLTTVLPIAAILAQGNPSDAMCLLLFLAFCFGAYCATRR